MAFKKRFKNVNVFKVFPELCGQKHKFETCLGFFLGGNNVLR
jgi:hypothetical protein